MLLARLAEFVAEGAVPWPRRLWDIGSVLSLEELWEAGRWEARGVLTAAATDWQRNELRAIVGRDVGLGERELRRELTGLLTGRLPDPSPARRRLRQTIDQVRVGYLERWAGAVADPSPPKTERLSRTVASHLLDLGYSPAHLADWVRRLRLQHVDAVEIVESAAALARAGAREYEVLVGLVKVPLRSQLAEPLDNWRSSTQVVAWLNKHGLAPGGSPNRRGLRLSVHRS